MTRKRTEATKEQIRHYKQAKMEGKPHLAKLYRETHFQRRADAKAMNAAKAQAKATPRCGAHYTRHALDVSERAHVPTTFVCKRPKGHSGQHAQRTT